MQNAGDLGEYVGNFEGRQQLVLLHYFKYILKMLRFRCGRLEMLICHALFLSICSLAPHQNEGLAEGSKIAQPLLQ